MAGVLKGAHPLERHRMAQGDVGRRDVDAELHAERAPERELPLELPLGENVDGAPREIFDEAAHGGRF